VPPGHYFLFIVYLILEKRGGKKMSEETLVVDGKPHSYSRRETLVAHSHHEGRPRTPGASIVFFRDQAHPPSYELVGTDESFLNLVACVRNNLCSGVFYLVYNLREIIAT
jgi:hypothetical protein